MRDLYHNIVARPVLHADPADNTASVGAIIDNRGLKSSTYVIHAGTLADADATFTALLEESDAADMSGAVAVDDAYLLGTEALASFQFDSDNSVKMLGYIGYKRYTRLTITPTGNGGAASYSAVFIGEPEIRGTVN